MNKPNVELKRYLLSFEPEKLENCKLFTKVYGKGYAKRRLKLNLKSVYVDSETHTNKLRSI